MDYNKQLEYFNKVLRSCKTIEQLDSVNNWHKNVKWNCDRNSVNICHSLNMYIDREILLNEMKEYLKTIN